MGRKSTVLRLPPDTRKKLDQALMDGRMTLDELHAFISSHCGDGEAPSRAAIWRYSNNFKEVAQAMRENREMARMLAQELGPESVEGDQGRQLIEMLRGLINRFVVMQTVNPGAKVDLGEVQKTARSLRDLSQAMRLEQDFAAKIRASARLEMQEQIRTRIRELGSAAELKELSDEELAQKLAELTADGPHA